MTATSLTVRRLSWDEPGLPAVWDRLLRASATRPISQTYEWQRLWWNLLGQGEPLLLLAEREGAPVALAPLYHDQGMVFFVGSGEADYHDFLGAAQDAEIMTAFIAGMVEHTPGFAGCRLHFVPETSGTVGALAEAAARLKMNFFHLKDQLAVVVDLGGREELVRQAVGRSMRKRENWFRQNGELQVRQLTTAAEILPLLPEFYEMHLARWRLKDIDSDFTRPALRTFLERWIEISAERNWLRVLYVTYNGRTLGTEFAWHFDGTQYSGQWVFALEHARRSPGHVLLRHSVLMALDAGMHTYDHGLGDQPYKFRLPCRSVSCATWGIFPP